MPFYIKNSEADQTVRLLSRLRGESLTETVLSALREQLEREQAKLVSTGMAPDLLEIARRFSELPELSRDRAGAEDQPAYNGPLAGARGSVSRLVSKRNTE